MSRTKKGRNSPLLSLSCAGVEGNSFRFRCPGFFRSKCQNDHRRNVRDHFEEVAFMQNVEVVQEVDLEVGESDRREETEKDRREEDPERFPLTENHDRQSQKPVSGNGAAEADRRGNDVGDAADAAERSGDQHSRPTHPVDIDAEGLRGMRMFAAGAESQTETRFLQHDYRHQQNDDAEVGRQISVLEEHVADHGDFA